MPPLTSSVPRREVVLYAVIALGALAVGLIYLLVLIRYGEEFARLDLLGGLYFIVLIPIALGAAGFLFGCLRSYARYKGHILGGAFELGGPAALAALVVAGGVQSKPVPSSFDLVVRFR